MEADITSQAVGLASNTDFSILSLFLRADIIVKSVIIILIASSVYSWAIIFDKIKMFRKINKSAEEFEEKFWKSKSAETFYNNLPANLNDPMAELFKNSMQTVIKARSRSNLSERLSGILK
jgi:Biopolymer transport proteins